MSSRIVTAYAGRVPTFVTCTTYSSVAPGERRPAADDRDVLRDAQLLQVADDDDGRLGPRRRVAVAVGQQVRQLRRVDDGLVRDHRAGRHTVVDAQIELHDGRSAGRQRARTAPGSGGVRFDELTSTPATSGDTPPSGRPTGWPFSVIESATYVVFAGTVSRSIACVIGSAAVVVDPDRVAQHVAGIDDARRHRIDLQRRRLLGVQPRHDRDGMRVLVVDDADRAVRQGARVGGAARIRGRRRCTTAVAPATFVSGVPY